MTGIRCLDSTGFFSTIERQNIGTQRLIPKPVFESLFQFLRLPRQVGRSLFLPQSLSHSRGRYLGSVYIGLHLAKSDWGLGNRSVIVKYRIVGILPSLVD